MTVRGQRKTQDPCEGCFLHRDRCLCEFIPVVETKTKITLVIHAKELKRTTNTGTLAAKALVNSQVLIRGKTTKRLDLSELLNPSFRPVLFFPTDDAIELNHEFVSQSELPIHLIVPDGNWRQASKVHHRHPELKDVPRVMIKLPNTDTHHLRAETTSEGMATLQAIAHALGVIEGESVRQQLLELYRLKLERTLQGRGVRI
jgi:DTW domain-containing protein